MSIRTIYESENLHIQQADYTCGPATLLNALAMMDDHSRTEDEVTVMCQAQPGSGTSNVMMSTTAAQLGMKVVEVRENAEITDLERHMDNGAHVIVCYLTLSESGHYAIVSDYDERAVYLRDCSYGLIRIEKPTFESRWRNLSEPARRWFMAVQ